jgi:hypothetical protein
VINRNTKFCVTCAYSALWEGTYMCYSPKLTTISLVTGESSPVNCEIVRPSKCLGKQWTPREPGAGGTPEH